MRVLKQVFYEFWLPILVAACWTYYRIAFPSQVDLSGIITHFVTAFVIISWAFGQLMRISHKHRTDDNFQAVKALLADLTSTVGTLSVANRELGEQAKDFPQLQPVISDIASLTLNAKTSVARANTAIAQAHLSVSDSGIEGSSGGLFGSEYAGRWEVWKALLDRNENRQELLLLGRKWLVGTEDRPEWPFVWQTLLDYDADKASLVERGRAWLAGREDRPEWSYVWRNLVSHDPARQELVALGARWLTGREDRPDWPFVWRKLLDFDTDRQKLLVLGRNWLIGREGRRGGSIIKKKVGSFE